MHKEKCLKKLGPGLEEALSEGRQSSPRREPDHEGVTMLRDHSATARESLMTVSLCQRPHPIEKGVGSSSYSNWPRCQKSRNLGRFRALNSLGLLRPLSINPRV